MKYKVKNVIIAITGVLLLLCLLSYLTANHNENLTLSSFNPMDFLEGLIFALGFGLGLSIWISIIIIGIALLVIFILFLQITRRIIK